MYYLALEVIPMPEGEADLVAHRFEDPEEAAEYLYRKGAKGVVVRDEEVLFTSHLDPGDGF